MTTGSEPSFVHGTWIRSSCMWPLMNVKGSINSYEYAKTEICIYLHGPMPCFHTISREEAKRLIDNTFITVLSKCVRSFTLENTSGNTQASHPPQTRTNWTSKGKLSRIYNLSVWYLVQYFVLRHFTISIWSNYIFIKQRIKGRFPNLMQKSKDQRSARTLT